MKDNAKLLVFDKLEISLILALVIFSSCICFVLGYSLGSKKSFLEAGYTNQDKKQIELLSKEEEATGAEKDKPIEKSLTKEDLLKTSSERIKDEFKAAEQDPVPAAPVEEPAVVPRDPMEPVATDDASSDDSGLRNKFVGKFTIQLAAYQDYEEAKKFASGIKMRGYKTLINEKLIRNQTWYSVGVDIFDTEREAKAFIEKEATLFAGKNYFIVRIE